MSGLQLMLDKNLFLGNNLPAAVSLNLSSLEHILWFCLCFEYLHTNWFDLLVLYWLWWWNHFCALLLISHVLGWVHSLCDIMAQKVVLKQDATAIPEGWNTKMASGMSRKTTPSGNIALWNMVEKRLSSQWQRLGALEVAWRDRWMSR